jgi:hypothetical protein
MRIHDALAAALLCMSFAALADDKVPDPYDEVVVADFKAPVFLELAPASVRKEMRVALEAACRAARTDPPKDDEGRPVLYQAFCDGSPLSFIREVFDTGTRSHNGFVCPARVVGNTVYFRNDSSLFKECVKVSSDYGSKLTVYFDWLGYDPNE